MIYHILKLVSEMDAFPLQDVDFSQLKEPNLFLDARA